MDDEKMAEKHAILTTGPDARLFFVFCLVGCRLPHEKHADVSILDNTLTDLYRTMKMVFACEFLNDTCLFNKFVNKKLTNIKSHDLNATSPRKFCPFSRCRLLGSNARADRPYQA